jgi:hypothetical protein
LLWLQVEWGGLFNAKGALLSIAISPLARTPAFDKILFSTWGIAYAWTIGAGFLNHMLTGTTIAGVYHPISLPSPA